MNEPKANKFEMKHRQHSKKNHESVQMI